MQGQQETINFFDLQKYTETPENHLPFFKKNQN